MLARSILAPLSLALAAAGTATAQTKLYSFQGDGAFDQLGEAVAAAGDVNNDGVPDLISGAPRDNSGGGLGYARLNSSARRVGECGGVPLGGQLGEGALGSWSKAR
jgi:hypothetical protein